jgi:hypothetical protein
MSSLREDIDLGKIGVPLVPPPLWIRNTICLGALENKRGSITSKKTFKSAQYSRGNLTSTIEASTEDERKSVHRRPRQAVRRPRLARSGGRCASGLRPDELSDICAAPSSFSSRRQPPSKRASIVEQAGASRFASGQPVLLDRRQSSQHRGANVSPARGLLAFVCKGLGPKLIKIAMARQSAATPRITARRRLQAR